MKRTKYLLLILSLVFVTSMLCACLNINLYYAHQFNEWSEIKPATCTQAGLEQRSCACGAVETRDIPALGHDYTSPPSYTWSDDNSVCTATIVCGNNCGVDKVVNATVSSERTPATRTQEGSTTYTATFTEQGYVTQTQIVEIAALGHDYTASPTYAWSDDYSACTARIVCGNNCGVNKVASATVTSSTTATCTEEGSTTYTATFTEQGYATQTQVVEIAALGHNYVNRVCTNCGDTVSYSQDLKYELSDDETYYTVTGIGDCKDTTVVIPDTYNGKPVTSIGEDAFRNCSSLTSIPIPSSVTSIGDFAFGGCTSLASVNFEEGSKCTSIGDWAFFGCTSITSITIPSSVTSIGEHAFHNCHSLIEVCNKSSLNITAGSSDNGEVGYYAKHIIINEADSFLTNVDDFIFYDDGTNVYFVKYVGEYTEITLPRYNDQNYTIYDYAFCYNDKIIDITIPSSVTSIGDYAFKSCTSLTSITIPSSVTSIGDYAFQYCYGLIEVCNKSSLNITAGSRDNGEVGYYAKHIIINEADSFLTNVDDFIFYDDGTNVYFVKYVGEDTEITLPRYNDKNYTIYDYAFYNNDKITYITIPSSVTSIGNEAFYNCSSLTSVTFEEGSKCTSIGYRAFQGCTRLTSITIPSSVTSIGDYAFSGCYSLTSITIPSSVTRIVGYAFSGCYSLIEVCNKSSLNITAGSSSYGEVGYYAKHIITDEADSFLTNVDDFIFYDDGTNVYLVKYFGEDTEITLPRYNYKNYTIYDYAFYNNDKITDITIPNCVTSIGDRAFYGCTSLTNVTIPNSVTSIGENAFYNTAYYNNDYNWINGVLYIDNYLIRAYISIQSCTIKEGTTVIADGAFEYCRSLNSVTFEEGSKCTSIGGWAFRYCSSLTSITIPSSVTSIGDYAFYDCSSLTSVTIPSSVTSIGYEAFYNCDSLTDVYYTGTQKQWNNISIDAFNYSLTIATIHYNYKG